MRRLAGLVAAATFTTVGVLAAPPASADTTRPTVRATVTSTGAVGAAALSAPSGDIDAIKVRYLSKLPVASRLTEAQLDVTTTPMDNVQAELAHRVADGVINGRHFSTDDPAGNTAWSVPFDVPTAKLTGYGTYTWQVYATRFNDQGYLGNRSIAYYPVDIRASGGLAVVLQRSGATVSVRAWTLAYNSTLCRFGQWGGRGVYVQKLQPNGSWGYAGGLTTDRTGRASRALATGAGTYRAYVKDDATIFGAITPPLTLK